MNRGALCGPARSAALATLLLLGLAAAPCLRAQTLGPAPFRWTVYGLGDRVSSQGSVIFSLLAVVVAGGLWKTRSVFQVSYKP